VIECPVSHWSREPTQEPVISIGEAPSIQAKARTRRRGLNHLKCWFLREYIEMVEVHLLASVNILSHRQEFQ
jgi:hypothetical protein